MTIRGGMQIFGGVCRTCGRTSLEHENGKCPEDVAFAEIIKNLHATKDKTPITPEQMLDWLQERAEEGCVTMCFEFDGGFHVTLDAMGEEQRAAREVNSIRKGIEQLMRQEKP